MSKYYKVDEVESLLSCGCAYAIRDLPTIEVSEGEWLFEEYPDGYYHSKCSICQHWFIEDAFLKPYKYCPNCGAKMKGADDDKA